MTKTSRPSYVQIDLRAIGENVRRYKNMLAGCPDCRLMAVVKANAYGHGAVPVAERALRSGAQWLGVALPHEAMSLREAGITAPILVLGFTEPDAYLPLIEAGVRMTVFTADQGFALAQAARGAGKRALVHLKVDTGMGRIGFWPGDEAVREIEALYTYDALEWEGCFTHFARADEDSEDSQESWRLQCRRFRRFLDRLRESGIRFPIVHCANTAAGMRDPETWMGMYRLGIGIYGLYPSDEVKAWGGIALEPALVWKSILSQVKWLPKGEGVSYGHTWIADKDTLVGTVPVGYADGYPRTLSNKGMVLAGGKLVPIIGRVCMDQFMVDLTEASGAVAGDEIVLIGEQGGAGISVEDIAKWAGTNNYEVLCRIGDRLPSVYVG